MVKILDILFSHTIGLSWISCQISIHFNIYFREFTAVINFLCSKSWLRIGVNVNDVIYSNTLHGFSYNNSCKKLLEYKCQSFCNLRSYTPSLYLVAGKEFNHNFI